MVVVVVVVVVVLVLVLVLVVVEVIEVVEVVEVVVVVVTTSPSTRGTSENKTGAQARKFGGHKRCSDRHGDLPHSFHSFPTLSPPCPTPRGKWSELCRARESVVLLDPKRRRAASAT